MQATDCASSTHAMNRPRPICRWERRWPPASRRRSPSCRPGHVEGGRRPSLGLRHERAGAWPDRPYPATSTRATATCTRSTTSSACCVPSRSGPSASAARSKRLRWSRRRSGRRRRAVRGLYVALECALDTWARRAEVALPEGPLAKPVETIDDEAIMAAAKFLGCAERPMIVVGGGALDAGPEVVELAAMLEAPVCSYRGGRGVVPSSQRRAVDLPVGHRLWKDADSVPAIGTRFFIQNGGWGIDADLRVVRLDIDPDEHERMRKPDVAIVGNAAPQLRAMIAALPEHNRSRRSRHQELVEHRAWLVERLSRLEPQVSLLKAIRAALAARRHLRRRGVADRLGVKDCAACREAAHLPVARLPGQPRFGLRHGTGRQGGDAARESAGDLRRRLLPVPGRRARDGGASQARRGRRGVRLCLVRQRQAPPAGALWKPANCVGLAKSRLLQAGRMVRRGRLQGTRRPASWRLRCTRPSQSTHPHWSGCRTATSRAPGT